MSERDEEHRRADERPRHPTKQAIWLLVGVTALIVALALFSSVGAR